MMTLRKISKITGFSTSTVSKALNNKLDISSDTRIYIQNVAKRTNYIPNKNAISLKKRKSHIIAVILPQINNTIYSEVLFNMQKTASNLGYRVLIFQSFTDEFKEKQFLDEINDGSVDGAIVFSSNQKKINKSNKGDIPVKYHQIIESIPLYQINKQCVEDFHHLLKQIA